MWRESPVDDQVLEILCGHVPADQAKPTEKGSRAGSLTTRRISDIEAKPVLWLWPGRIARGKVTVIAGNPGLGKSQITASIAGIVTTGGLWPVDGTRCIAGEVLFLTAEDDPADTLRPRLEAAGADLSRVHIIDGVLRGYTGNGVGSNAMFSLQSDLPALEEKLAELRNVAAVVIDPITAYLGDADSHRNAEVRALLAPLTELAARHGTAILAVSHMNKTAGAQALMRVSGSLAFVAAARAAYVVTEDRNDKSRRLLLPMKNNIGPDSTGLAFRIEGVTVASAAGPLPTSRIVWDSEPVSITADEAMQSDSGGARSAASAVDDAADWLRETLADGPMNSKEVTQLANEALISEQTLRRARGELGITPQKVGMDGPWRWSLPSKMLKTAEDVQQNSVSIFGKVEHLRESHEVEVEL